ncbi:hypothetical protein Hypma_012306 [Hypsizygus marmoreus]|uniref:Uncharacterized protein n=1 Tax=Hypsizygus marmoreus TaxID=39966 RepID=A0A369JJG2_HYPMA|nr:hypothetical protein Hypma_012306 [Hypsizygus marmoreus]
MPECARPLPPPLTLDDIGPSPPLRNKESFRGPIVKTYLLGFVMTFEDLAQWGADHGLDPDGDAYNAYQRARHTLSKVIPHPTMVATARYGPHRICCTSYVVATNRTPEERARASDLEFVERVRTILDKTDPPIWHRPVRLW